MSWRKLVVGEKEYRYKVGHGTTEVRLGRAVVLRVDNHVLVGVDPSVFERGKRKRTSDGMVTPSMVAVALRAR